MTLATLDVAELVGSPGTSRERMVTGTIAGLTSELASVPADAPVRATLLLESVIEGVVVSGELSGRWSLRCARCLSEFEGEFLIAVHELFTAEPDPETDGYTFDPAVGIEIDQLARDEIGVEMPFSPLCRPGCLGLCETCGGDRNLGQCPGHETADPRFAVLSELSWPDAEES